MKTCLSVMLLCSFFASIGHAQELAKVGDRVITVAEFNKRYEEIKRQASNPPSKKIFLEDLVRYEMGVQEAEKRNLAKDPLVAERLRQELYKGLIEKDLGKEVSSIQVTEGEMQSYYKNNPEVRFQHILIDVKAGATAAEKQTAKTRAEEILAEVKKGPRKFEELVNLYTDDLATKKNGGDVGFQTRLSIYPTLYEGALKLKVGQTSGLIETPYGFHIIKVTGINSYKEASKRPLRAAVFEEKRLKIFNEYFRKVKGKYKVTVNESLLN